MWHLHVTVSVYAIASILSLINVIPQAPYRSFAPERHWDLSSPSCIQWRESLCFSLRLAYVLVTTSAVRQTLRGPGTMRLDDNDKHLVQICLYCLKCTKFGHEIWPDESRENYLNCCHQMSDFKAKMHQIRFRLGLRPRPRWGELTALPQTP